MKYLPQNTLGYFNAAPQFKIIDLSHIPVKALARATKEYRKSCGLTSPDESAIKFYAMNHCASLVRKEFTNSQPLPDWALKIMQLYESEVSEQGNRMLHYVFSICVREMRHLKNHKADFFDTLASQLGTEMKEFIKKVRDFGDYADGGAVEFYMDTPLEVGIGTFMKALAWAFHNGNWNSGYGGTAWGNVADACASFVTGNTSMEMMIDTGYTLAHNGGPIFNKGMMYQGYDSTFTHILDIQRSGQIPELLLDESDYDIEKPDMAKLVVDLVKETHPEAFGSYVDWYKVEAMGAVNNYNSYKKMQDAKHKKKAEAPKVEPVQMFNGKKIKIVGEVPILPGQSVKIFQRVSA